MTAAPFTKAQEQRLRAILREELASLYHTLSQRIARSESDGVFVRGEAGLTVTPSGDASFIAALQSLTDQTEASLARLKQAISKAPQDGS